MMQPQSNIAERYTTALDRVVEQLQADYYVLAAVLYGGLAGGRVVAQGTPEQVTQVEESYTGQYLKTVIVG
jgi:excinuclease ABC subunit A